MRKRGVDVEGKRKKEESRERAGSCRSSGRLVSKGPIYGAPMYEALYLEVYIYIGPYK